MVPAALLWVTLAIDADAVPNIDQVKVDAAEQRTQLLKKAQERQAAFELLLRRFKAGVVDGKSQVDVFVPDNLKAAVVFQSREIKVSRIKTATANVERRRKNLAAAKKGELPLMPCLSPPLNEGKVGRMDPARVEIFQVAGPEEMLGYARFTDRDGDTTGKLLVWITGVSTANLSDEGTVSFDDEDDIFVVNGTHTYTTAIGASKTVKVLKRLSDVEQTALFNLLKPAAK